ncbi:PAAR domain-containing protein [Duganella levis]|uniref:PAAR domain-containing protein n=1 Tax=Duganella levis TaxID=2692169 RepID=UPI001E3E58E1|nr:PAAR domain-containing protein [Duganella levis]
MKRYTVTLGASTTAGGKVISASSHGAINGVPIALENDGIFCPPVSRMEKSSVWGREFRRLGTESRWRWKMTYAFVAAFLHRASLPISPCAARLLVTAPQRAHLQLGTAPLKRCHPLPSRMTCTSWSLTRPTDRPLRTGPTLLNWLAESISRGAPSGADPQQAIDEAYKDYRGVRNGIYYRKIKAAADKLVDKPDSMQILRNMVK